MNDFEKCIDLLQQESHKADDEAREYLYKFHEKGSIEFLFNMIVEQIDDFTLSNLIPVTSFIQFHHIGEEADELIEILRDKIEAIEDDRLRNKWNRIHIKKRKRKESAEGKDNEIRDAAQKFAENRDKLFNEYSIGEVKDIDEYIAKLIEADRGLEVGKLFYEQGKEIMQYCTKLDFEVLRDGDIHTFMIGAELQKHGQMDLQIAHDLGIRDE